VISRLLVLGGFCRARVSPKELRTEGLLRSNSVLETAAQTSLVIGPALVGVLAATIGIEVALLVNAATFAASLVSVGAVSRRAVRPRRRRRLLRGLGADFADGLRFLVGFRALLALTIVQTLVNLCLAVDTLIVFFARDTLALPVSYVSAVVVAGGAGGVAGAITAPWFGARIRPLPLIAWGLLVIASALVVMGVSTVWWSLPASNVVLIWAIVVVSVVNRSTRQAWIPRELLGRVSTIVRALFHAATPLGAVVAGAVTRACGSDPRPAFLAAGVLVAVITGVGWTAALRHYDSVSENATFLPLRALC
jgi:predicted MFS family arabinose efflux permease